MTKSRRITMMVIVLGLACIGSVAGAVKRWVAESRRPDSRDVAYARMTGKDADDIALMERGQWPEAVFLGQNVKSDIDFAIRAVDYMRDTYGTSCAPTKAEAIRLLHSPSFATLKMLDGDHAGEEVRVEERYDPERLADNLYWHYHHAEFERECGVAVTAALEDLLPDGSWAHVADLSTLCLSDELPLETPVSEATCTYGSVDVYFTDGVDPTLLDLDDIMDALVDALSGMGPTIDIYIHRDTVTLSDDEPLSKPESHDSREILRHEVLMS